MDSRPPYRVTVLGQIHAAYDEARRQRPLSGAKQYALAMLVAGGHSGIEATAFGSGSSAGGKSLDAVRMSITRLRDHLPTGALPDAAAGRYRLTVPVADVDVWHLRSLVVDPFPAELDVARLRHLLRPVDPYAPFADAPTLVDASRAVLRLQHDLLARLAAERPDLLGGHFIDDLLAHLDGDPYNERLVLLCGRTLARAGHRRQALNLLSRARRELATFGLDAGAQLVALEDALLAGEFAIDVDPLEERGRPRQLPALLVDQLASPFVGPDDHVETLRATLEDGGGWARCVLVHGRSGVGKTRACAEIAAHARALDVHVLYTAPTREGGAALGPLLAVLPGLRERAAHLFDRHDDVESRKAALWAACWRSLQEEAGTRPLLLIIDDCQWLDSYTSELLVHLAGHVTSAPVAVVLAGRDDGPGASAWHRLVEALSRLRARRVDVQPLDERAMVEFVRVRWPRLTEAQARAVAWDVHAASAGLPGVAAPLVDALDEVTLTLPSADEVDPGTALDAAVRQLGANARTVGAVGSVVGPRFDLDLAVALTGLPFDRVLTAVDDLVRRGLVVEHSATEYAVTHVLVQAAFVESETRSRLAGWHRTAAALFERDVHRCAFHRAAAVPLVPPGEAAASLVVSARAHLDSGEHRAALAAFRRADELAGPLPPRDAGRYARALDLSGVAELAREVRQDAFERALSGGDVAGALRIATSGLPEAEPVDGDTTIVDNLVRIDPAALEGEDAWHHAHQLARQLAIVGRLGEAAKVARRLPGMAQTAAQRVDAAVCRRFVLSATSPPAVRLAALRAAADDVVSVGATRAAGHHLVSAIDHYEAGHVEEAVRALARIDLLGDEVPRWRRWHAALFDAMVATDRGEVAAACERRQVAFDLGVRTGVAEAENALLAAEFVDLWLRGRVGELRGEVEGGLLDPRRSVLTRAGAAIVLAASGDADRAVEHAIGVTTSVRRSPVAQGLAALALVSEVLARSSSPTVDVARRMLERRGDSMIVIGAGAACLGPARRYVAMLERTPARAVERLASARALADRAGLALWQAVTRRELYTATGDRAHLDGVAAVVDGTDLADLMPLAT